MAANELIARLFASRTAAHMAHLQTRSFAEHKALDEFYNEVVEVADSFAEVYQGIFGLITYYPDVGFPSGKPVGWINGLREWLEKNREDNCKGKTALENISDEASALCAGIVYKLKFLDNPAISEEPDEDDMEGMSAKGKDKDYMGMAKWKVA